MKNLAKQKARANRIVTNYQRHALGSPRGEPLFLTTFGVPAPKRYHGRVEDNRRFKRGVMNLDNRVADSSWFKPYAETVLRAMNQPVAKLGD